jgi:nitrogen fixation-related uncharacterized protein
MNEATIAQTVMSLLLLAIFLGFLIWGIKTKQFKNIEDAKYTVFRDENEPRGEEDKKSGEKKEE